MKLHWIAFAIVPSLFLGGCATVLSVAIPNDEVPYQIAYTPDDTVVQVQVTPATRSFPVSQAILGGAIDVAVAVNLSLLGFTFRAPEDAYLVSGLVSLGLLGADLIILALGGTPLPASVEVAQGGSLSESYTLYKHAGKATAKFQLASTSFHDPHGVGVPCSIRFLDQQGQLKFEDRQVFRPVPASEAKLTPPDLEVRVGLTDPLGERVFQAEYGGTVDLKILNRGEGMARGVVARLTLDKAIPGLGIPEKVIVGDLKPGEQRQFQLPVSADVTIPDATATLLVDAVDANRFDARRKEVIFQTRALRLPELVIAESIDCKSAKGGDPEPGEQLNIRYTLQNQGKGRASSVKTTLIVEDPNIIVLGSSTSALGDLKPGQWTVATFSVFVNYNYSGPQLLPFRAKIEEKHPQVARETAIPVKLFARNSGGPDVWEPLGIAAGEITSPPSLVSDVDLPLKVKQRPDDPDAIAVVIGIEHYNAKIPKVRFAVSDARRVRDYFIQLFGVKPENLILLTDREATKGAIQTALEGRLVDLVQKGKSAIYVYYAGHGAPDPKTKTAFLVPYDGDPDHLGTSCYPLASFYNALRELGARRTTVMLDACFTGQTGRGDDVEGLLADARPIILASISDEIPQGTVVLAAAKADEYSSGYPKQAHGLFTYFLLKGIREAAEARRSLSIGALGKYLEDKVSAQARLIGRKQTPVLLGSDRDRELLGHE